MSNATANATATEAVQEETKVVAKVKKPLPKVPNVWKMRCNPPYDATQHTTVEIGCGMHSLGPFTWDFTWNTGAFSYKMTRANVETVLQYIVSQSGGTLQVLLINLKGGRIRLCDRGRYRSVPTVTPPSAAQGMKKTLYLPQMRDDVPKFGIEEACEELKQMIYASCHENVNHDFGYFDLFKVAGV